MNVWSYMNPRLRSQPARAVWIEISYINVGFTQSSGHSLRGLCGLKCQTLNDVVERYRHSLRGLCGLKLVSYGWLFVFFSHSLRGLCGLKCPVPLMGIFMWSHSLRGLCGLKYVTLSHSRRNTVVTACEGCVD